tara:strand:- start:418 stop:531 length:114 start_codon:yes stop_codon:yes gene_type:complete
VHLPIITHKGGGITLQLPKSIRDWETVDENVDKKDKK